MTITLNLYGGPGTGKSTSAAFLFYALKQEGINTELVREYVKNWAWEGRHIGRYDQVYFLGKQIRHETLLHGKVDYIVTDSPIFLNLYYAKKFAPEHLSSAVAAVINGYYKQQEADGHKHVHVFMKRTKAYNPAGRFQTLEQAKEIDDDLLQLMSDLSPIHCGTDEFSLRQLISTIIKR